MTIEIGTGFLTQPSTSPPSSARPARWPPRSLSRGGDEGQEGRDLRPARRLHADLLGEARPRLRRAVHALKAKGVDEVWCVSVNDGYVMAAWGKDQKALGKSACSATAARELTKKLGLEIDLIGRGMGVRMSASRCSSTTAW